MNHIFDHIKRGRILTIVAIIAAIILFLYYRKKKADEQAAADAAVEDSTDPGFTDPNTDLTGTDNPYDMGQYANPGGIPTDIFGSGINSANPYPPAAGTRTPVPPVTINLSPAGGGPPNRNPVHHPGSGTPASTTGDRIDTHTGPFSHQDMVGISSSGSHPTTPTRSTPAPTRRVDPSRRSKNRKDLVR